MTEPGPEIVLGDIASHLRRLGKPFALVGGMAVSLRGEVRFTRDVDLAIAAPDDTDNLILLNEGLDIAAVKANLALITERGFHRDQDLFAKLDAVLASAAAG